MDNTDTNLESRYIFIEGTLQLGDDGSVWNLYYDSVEKKVRLRVDRKNLPPHFIPDELHTLL